MTLSKKPSNVWYANVLDMETIYARAIFGYAILRTPPVHDYANEWWTINKSVFDENWNTKDDKAV